MCKSPVALDQDRAGLLYLGILREVPLGVVLVDFVPNLLQVAKEGGTGLDVASPGWRSRPVVVRASGVAGHAPLAVEVLLLEGGLYLVPDILLFLLQPLELALDTRADVGVNNALTLRGGLGSLEVVRELVDDIRRELGCVSGLNPAFYAVH